MINQQYTLEEISYDSERDSRIMKAVLKNWFNNPKELNFVSPRLKFPFSYNQWKKSYMTSPFGTETTIVAKHNGWIIGHASFEVNVNDLRIFHLFVETAYRHKELISNILDYIDPRAKRSNVKNILFYVSSKNILMINIFKKLGYKEEDLKKIKSVKMLKRVQ